MDGPDALKGRLDAGATVAMDFMGSDEGTCEEMPIPDDEKIVYIELESDGQKLRKMTVDLSNFDKMTFGNYDGPWNDHPKKTFIFEDKADLLGIYGYGEVNEENGFVDIVNLGFLANECPIRDLLEWERTYHSDKNPAAAVVM